MMGIASPLKYPGGKSHLVEELAKLIPPHRTFIDLTAGGLSLLLSLDPEGRSEIVNDLDESLTNFWEAMKSPSRFYAFQRVIEATPFSEDEFSCARVFGGDEVEQAVAFFVSVRQSMGGMQKSFAPISTSRVRRGMNEQVSAWISAVDGLEAVHKRLRRVLIMNRDMLDAIDSLDGPDTFLFIDPPYLTETRVSKKLYQHEFSDDDHRRLLERLATIEGKFLLCGYPSATYSDFAEKHSWHSRSFEVPNSASKKRKKEIKSETVWTNYILPETP